VPAHCRMRDFGRDLIRGGHYGQRSCEPHLQAEHMAAPTNAANVKISLANTEDQPGRSDDVRSSGHTGNGVSGRQDRF
jgi:hypothetical protein